MKLITFCVPSYNSQDYMRHCIDCLLNGKDDVEIIIVDDGSTDSTSAIADEYQNKYPTIVKAIHQENSGHGEGVNQGARYATGLYYKVVDSDDWLDDNGYKTLLETIKKHLSENNLPDCYFMDFVYNKPSASSQFVRDYKKQLPENRMFSWDEVRKFNVDQIFLMHALIYKTEKYRESKCVLPKHTFYVDDIFAYTPLPYMKKLFYIPTPLYMYFIGRSDQSVTIDNIIKRYKMQITVQKEMFNAYSYKELLKMDKPLRKYMIHCLMVILMVTLFFTCGKNTKERKEDTKELWRYLKKKDKRMYYRLKYRSYATVVNFLPFKLKGKIMTRSYLRLVKKENLG